MLVGWVTLVVFTVWNDNGFVNAVICPLAESSAPNATIRPLKNVVAVLPVTFCPANDTAITFPLDWTHAVAVVDWALVCVLDWPVDVTFTL